MTRAATPRRGPTRAPEAPLSQSGVLLEVVDLDFGYDALQILFSVSVTVTSGVSTALLGTNGAGKSTLLRVIAGLQAPQRGTVRFDGEDITRLTPDERVRRGLTLVEGGRAMFPSVSVLDNLRMGAYTLPKRSPRIATRLSDVLTLFPALQTRLRQPAGTLSGGEQQMLAIGRALMSAPRLLMIDELSLGLAPVVMQQIAAVVEEMTDQGTTLLLVEQSLNVALALSTQAHFMEKGQIRFSGPTSELMARGDLVRSVFFGGSRSA